MKTFAYISCFFFLIQMQAQVKNEQERRIKKKDVPTEVMSWFKDAYEKQRNVKWFYQTDGEKKVYEAKLTYQNKKHSVEILPNGILVNIEVLIDFDEIETLTKQIITTYFETEYDKYKIKKVQIQYVGSNDDLEDLIDENELDDDIKMNYEIEFYGKNKTKDELWEALFDAEGILLQIREIKLKATDNLDY